MASNRGSEGEKMELQIKLRGWSNSVLATFHDAAVSKGGRKYERGVNGSIIARGEGVKRKMRIN